MNDDEELVDGKKTQWRDAFAMMPTSRTLIAAMDLGNGTLKTLITTRGTRRSSG